MQIHNNLPQYFNIQCTRIILFYRFQFVFVHCYFVDYIKGEFSVTNSCLLGTSCDEFTSKMKDLEKEKTAKKGYKYMYM